jgi:hypothetical protein
VVRTLFQVCRFKYDIRRLASEFQGHLQSFTWKTSERRLQTNAGLNSIYTFFKLLFAAASIILRPVTVEPVKATLSTSGCAASADPPTGPSEGTVLITPAGNLTRSLSIEVCIRTELRILLPRFFHQFGKFLSTRH